VPAPISTELIEAVAARTAACDFKIWGFGEGPALLGLLKAGERLDQPAFIEQVAEHVIPSLNRDPDPTDHLIPVEVLVKLRQLRPALNTSRAITHFANAVLSAARPAPGEPPVHRRDLDALRTTLWVDCLHTDIPGLTLAGYPAESVRLAEECCSVLQDSSNLFSHGYDVASHEANGIHWGRGQGWALHGLCAAVSDIHLRNRLSALLDALTQHEHAGSWHTIIDDPASPIEHSVSALVASGIFRLANDGRTSPDLIAMARRCLVAATHALDACAGLPVSGATPVGNRENYMSTPSGIFPWGQGPLLLALLEGEHAL
jgi:unsaturated rhamnogalacturonyl hydrolase